MTAARRAAVARLAVLGAAIALYAYADGRPTRAPGAATLPDPDVVAVLPFSVRGSQPALADLCDAIQDLIAARLPGGDGTPRALDAPATSDARRRVGPSPGDVISLETSMRVAGDLGAGQLLRGEVSGTPDHVTVEAELVAVPGGMVQAQARVEAGADSLPYLADRLVARLLAVQAARDSGELAALTSTSLPALRAYLAGQAAYRRGNVYGLSGAAERFERALFLDSTFTLAALRLAALQAVIGRAGLDERWKFTAIWRQRDRLTPADRALLLAYLGPRYPHPATLAELIAAGEAAARAAPSRVEAWYIAGANFRRFGSVIGYPGWEARATEALERAFRLDSTDAHTLDDLLLLAGGAGDRAAVRRYADLYVRHNAVAESADFVRWLAAAALDDSHGREMVRRRFGTMTRFSLQRIAAWGQVFGVALEDAERAAHVFLERAENTQRHTNAVRWLTHLLLNRGRPGEANRALRLAEGSLGPRYDVGATEFRIYAALYWDGDSSEAASAARVLEAYVGGASQRPEQVRDPQTASCALAHWRLATGDAARARAAIEGVRRAPALADPPPAESTPVCAAAVEAQIAAAGEERQAGGALEQLDALLRAGSDARELVPQVANLIAARLYEQRGDARTALAIVRRRTGWTEMLSTELREEGRLAALLGDRAGAIRAYRHYLALRSDPEPELRSDVERVRRELARLERGP